VKKNSAAKKSCFLVVQIMDDNIGRIDVQITPQGIFCTLCDHTTLVKNNNVWCLSGPAISGKGIRCEHIRLAVSQPNVVDVIKQKQREGWKIELPTDQLSLINDNSNYTFTSQA
jgi:hypothetical protein